MAIAKYDVKSLLNLSWILLERFIFHVTRNQFISKQNGCEESLLRSSSLILASSSSLVPLEERFLDSKISVTCPKVIFSGLGQGPVSCRKSCKFLQQTIETTDFLLKRKTKSTFKKSVFQEIMHPFDTIPQEDQVLREILWQAQMLQSWPMLFLVLLFVSRMLVYQRAF